jgi:succinate dehydrogenase / fumarate reductase flavoprotein subunit
MMGGVQVDPDSQMSQVPGLFAAGECGAGLHGANRLGGNSLSDLLVFGKRAGQYAAEYAKQNFLAAVNLQDVASAEKRALAPFERDGGEGPYAVQYALQEMMQDLVGIVRQEKEMQQALDLIQELKTRAERCGVTGHREYNSGWHTAIDLNNLLTVSEMVTKAALERKESRGAHFRDDYPDKDKQFGSFNIIIRKGADGGMQIHRVQIPEMPQELKQIIEEMK